MSKTIDTPVLIVGAGPVGLQLALDLGWRGIECRVIDQQDGGPAIHPRAAGISVRTMEFCRRWGIAEQVRNGGFPLDFQMNVVYCTALEGHLIERQNYPTLRDQPPVPFSPENKFRCPQTLFDPILAKAARAYPSVHLAYGHRLEGFHEGPNRLDAEVIDQRSGEKMTVRCQYLVACDGSDSGIAKLCGVDYDGDPALSYSVNAVIRAPGLAKAHKLGEAERYLFIGPNGAWSNLTVIDGRDLWRFTVIGSEQKMDLEALDMAAEIRRAFGTDRIQTEILAVAPWRRKELVARRFRVGRVLFAGDAAHSMSPTGGHGMNTGAGDAVDLGWKLEAVLRGWGGAGLLDSYEAERRPVAIRNAAASSRNFRTWVSAENTALVLEDSPEGAAFRASVGRRLKEGLKMEWESWGVQLGYRYEQSPICIADGTPPPADDPAEYVPTARPGSRAPHAWLKDGRSTIDLFGRGFTLLRLGATDSLPASLGEAAAQRGTPLSIVDIDDPAIRELYEAALVLVRPDGHVAWRGDRLPDRPLDLVDTVRGAVG